MAMAAWLRHRCGSVVVFAATTPWCFAHGRLTRKSARWRASWISKQQALQRMAESLGAGSVRGGVKRGLCVVRDCIVEVGIVSEHGACFSTVVRPPVVPTEAECDNSVHGIPAAELRAGPEFKAAYARMIAFLLHLEVSTARLDDSDSEAEPCVTTSYDDPPQILLVSHNGLKFDFAILVSEVMRSKSDYLPLQRFGYVETLDVFRPVSTGCVKLQCLCREHTVGDGHLRAHRALDDAIALRDVVVTQAERLGVTLCQLLAPFVMECDLSETLIQEESLRLARNQPL